MLKLNVKSLIPKENLRQKIILMIIFAVLTMGYIFTFMPRTTFENINIPNHKIAVDEITSKDTLIQEITVKEGVLKGIGVEFNTHYRRNTAEYKVDFLDANKNVLHQNVFNADKLPNEGIYTMPLPNISVSPNSTYYIRITTEEGEPGNALGVFLANIAGKNAVINDEEAQGSLVASIGYASFSVPMVVITLFFVIAVCLALLFFGNKMHYNILVLVIILGVFFALFTPILDTPDETEHFAKPLHMLNGGFITSTADGGSYLSDSFQTVNLNKGNTILNNTLQGVPYDTHSTKELWGSGQFFFGYLPQTLGLGIARLFNADILTMFYMGRILNVLVYGIFAFFAVKIAPKFKLYLSVLAIMPMALIISGSYNSDGLIYGLCLLFGGYLLDLIYNRTFKISFRNILIFSIIMALIVMKKYSLMPFVLLILFIPKERFISKKTKYLGFLFSACFALAVMLVLFMINVALNMDVSGEQTSALAPGGVNDRGASMYGQLAFILQNPSVAYSVFTKTIAGFLGDNLMQTFSLGWLTYDVYSIFAIIYFAFLAVVAFSYSRYEHEGMVAQNTSMSLINRGGILIIIMFVILTTYLMLYLSWTAVGAATIEGVQGRYFVPILFLLPLIGQNVFPVVSKEAYTRSKINVMFVAILLASVTFLTVLTHNY